MRAEDPPLPIDSSAIDADNEQTSSCPIAIGSELPNPISPDLLSGAERIAAVCEILAAGLIRLQARQSSRKSAINAENFLDTRSEESGHAAKPIRKAQQ